MEMPKVALVGGTGIGDLLLKGDGRAVHVPTPFGLLRGRISESGFLVVARHGPGHKLPPHRIDYRRMAGGLKRLGVDYCLASAAVGSLREDWGIGTMIACSDFLELSGRSITMFEPDIRHTDFTDPIDPDARRLLVQEGVIVGGVYVCAPGPRYETPAEIEFYRRVGGDVVGMTAGTEAVAMREAGIKYAVLAIVSNFATGLAGKALSHAEVEESVRGSGERAAATLITAAEALGGTRV